MSEKIKVAVIGCGGISQFHLDAYQANPRVEIYALCDIDEKQVNKRGAEYSVPPCRRYLDCETMLKDLPEIDAVSVCTWNSAHAPCTIAALKAGKHVLCEKPMALNAKEAQSMIDAAKESGKLLMIGFVRRFGNDCAIMQDLIDDGQFGEIYYAKATYLRRNGNPGGWFGDQSRSGGGPLIDLGVHVIDLTRYLMGNHRPVSVYGATFQKLFNRPDIKLADGYKSVSATDHDICDVEDAVTALIRFDNGSVVSVEASFTLNLEKDKGDIEFFGTKAGAKMDPELHIYSTMNGYMTNINLAAKSALSFDGLFANEINHFVDCVIDGIPCKNPAEDGLTLMRILDGIYESARTGHEVIL
ncbi:MAG: Gfo/Idh/MocA family oxidoreductase [Clostridia bacterium]|nr:Gfo/Idh/MocA family oxidoreductase [Clostridia bacterium]